MKYDINLINSMEFDKEPEEEYAGSYELTANQVKGLPRNDEDLSELRNMLADIFAEKLGESYAQLESRCDIGAESFRKYIRHLTGRVIPAEALAKFCVGAGVSPDEAKLMFELSGRKLSERRRFDYILLCTLENKENLLEFDRNLAAYGEKGILSDCK